MFVIYETNLKAPVGRKVRYPIAYHTDGEVAYSEIVKFRKARKNHYEAFGSYPPHVQFMVEE